jgi:multidrug efflux pump subunit AcrA (membrane-fusion protein)
VEESRIALGYTRIEAQESGQVAKRMAEPGDMAWPGKALLLLQTRGALRLESLVREGLIHRIRVGSRMTVSVDVLDRELEGVVDEVVPFADPVTRTFLVKVSLPHAEGLYPGMFGRLLVPVGDHEIVTAPREAIVRVGQLEMVTVRVSDRWERIFVKTGRAMGDRVEVLAGLDGGETLALEGSAP